MAVILVWAWLAVKLAGALASAFTIFALGGFGGDMAQVPRLRLSDSSTRWTAVASLFMLLVTGIAVLRWIALANRNAQTWNDQIDISPGWAIGWFFVPVMNLFEPFRGVSATWRATVAPADINSVAVPAILRWWWGLWLAMSFWGNIASYFLRHAETPAQLVTAHWATIATLLIDIPLAIVLSRLIARLSAMQSQVLASSDRPIFPDDESI